MPEQTPAARRKFTVAVDLDGVLARYDSWDGLDLIGEPIPGAVDFVNNILSKGLHVSILTTRCNGLLNPPESCGRAQEDPQQWQRYLRRNIENWLLQNGFPITDPAVSVYDGPGKPLAVAYVDDRAVACRPQYETNPQAAYAYALNVISGLAEIAETGTPPPFHYEKNRAGDFARLVQLAFDCREAQSMYFRTKEKQDLLIAKRMERDLDAYLKYEMESGKGEKDLFDNPEGGAA